MAPEAGGGWGSPEVLALFIEPQPGSSAEVPFICKGNGLRSELSGIFYKETAELLAGPTVCVSPPLLPRAVLSESLRGRVWAL